MLTTLLLAVAAQAAPPAPPAAPEPEKRFVREIIVLDGKDAKDAPAPDGTKRHREIMIIDRDGDAKVATGGERVRVIRHGTGDDRVAMIHKCEGAQQFETKAEGEQDGKKVRTEIKLCHKGKQDPAKMVEGLERASKRIAESKDMPEDVRTRVLASLNAEIARLKAGKQ